MPPVDDYQPHELMLSRDRKVSPLGIWQASRRRWVPTIRNSFGLPAGVTCPGATKFCDGCYAKLSEQGEGVAGGVARNYRLLLEADGVAGMTDLLSNAVARFRVQARRIDPSLLMFRIHWDGDFFSLDYAEAWATVIRANPGVRFWCYTRSFTVALNVVPVLDGLDNLALYLSIDRHNADRAREVLDQHPSVLGAWCETDYQSARALAGDRAPVVCPENDGRLLLMQDGVGACVRCLLCVDGKRDVIFSTSHKEDSTIVEIRRARKDPAPSAKWEVFHRPAIETIEASQAGPELVAVRRLRRADRPHQPAGPAAGEVRGVLTDPGLSATPPRCSPALRPVLAGRCHRRRAWPEPTCRTSSSGNIRARRPTPRVPWRSGPRPARRRR